MQPLHNLTGVVPSHQVALVYVLQFQVGSENWSWDDEERDLLQRTDGARIPGGYQLALEAHLRGRGRIEQPILLGDDGRIWDGHHRIVAARRLGFTTLPAECFCGTETPCTALPVAKLLEAAGP